MKLKVFSNMMNTREFYVPNHPKCKFEYVIKIHLDDSSKNCLVRRYELFENGNEIKPDSKDVDIVLALAEEFIIAFYAQ